VKARTVTAEQGTFEAVVSTQRPDREKDVVMADAMVTALRRWHEVGKRIPLAWAHSQEAEDIIGHVDPLSAKAVDGEVHVSGWIDRSTPRGKDAWRLAKSGTLGFSFGYMIHEATKEDDGTRVISALDVFEVSACSTPMNNDTRVVSWKTADGEREPPSLEELRALKEDLQLDEDSKHRQRIADEYRRMFADILSPRHANGHKPEKTQRERAEKTAREVGPIQVTSFRC
jgi:uncharacterized protein